MTNELPGPGEDPMPTDAAGESTEPSASGTVAATVTVPAGRVEPVVIEDEMRASYLDYAMSVIVGRALPDVRDGLKPVHRRILFSMDETGLRPDRPYRKCASAVGDVMKKYHPHGDSAIYDALVRMGQDFSIRYELIDGVLVVTPSPGRWHQTVVLQPALTLKGICPPELVVMIPTPLTIAAM